MFRGEKHLPNDWRMEMKEVKRKLNEKNDKKLLPLIKLMMKCTLALLYLLWQHLRLHSNEKRQNKHAITSIYTNTTLQIRTKSFCSKNYYSLLLFVDSRFKLPELSTSIRLFIVYPIADPRKGSVQVMLRAK